MCEQPSPSSQRRMYYRLPITIQNSSEEPPTPPPDARAASDAFSAHVLDAVVKIFTTHCEPDFSLPWQMKPQDRSTASGFVLPGHRILTNAHAVDRATVITVKKRGSDVRYHAKLLFAGTEPDLVLLAVADPAFWATPIAPLPLGAPPAPCRSLATPAAASRSASPRAS